MPSRSAVLISCSLTALASAEPRQTEIRVQVRSQGRGHSRRPVDGSGRTLMTAAPGKLEIHWPASLCRRSARGLRNRYRVGATPTTQKQVTVSATPPTSGWTNPDASRGARPRRHRGAHAHDAGRYRDAAERTGRYARPSHVALARCRERPHSGNERPVHSLPGRWPAAVRPGGGLLEIPPIDLGTAASSTAASSSVSKWWKACARAAALLRRARRRLSFLLFREELLRIEVGRESDIEETDHHLFPALVAPRDGLGGVGVVRVVH